MTLYYYFMPFFCVGLLSLSSCAGPAQDAEVNHLPKSPAPTVGYTPSPENSEVPSEANASPILPESSMPPFDDALTQATAAPPSEYFVKLEPTTVCLGDTLAFSAHLSKEGAKSLFLEQDLNREGKVPYFAGPYVLVQRFDIPADGNIDYTFTLTDPMPDAEKDKTLSIQSGKYLVHLVHEDGEITGVDYITVKECDGA